MPPDVGDEIGAPELCTHHRAVVNNLAEKDHIDDRESTRVAIEFSRQHCKARGEL